jgi:hypothetical protein
MIVSAEVYYSTVQSMCAGDVFVSAAVKCSTLQYSRGGMTGMALLLRFAALIQSSLCLFYYTSLIVLLLV